MTSRATEILDQARERKFITRTALKELLSAWMLEELQSGGDLNADACCPAHVEQRLRMHAESRLTGCRLVDDA